MTLLSMSLRAKRSNLDSRGVTFLELVIVVAVLLIIFVSIMGNFQAFQRRTVLSSSAEQAQSYLREAQNRAITRQDDKDWGVRVNSSSLELFDGNAYGSATNIETLAVSASVTVTHSLQPTPGTTQDIVFTRLDGKTVNSGTITLTQGTESFTITISTSGNIVIGS